MRILAKARKMMECNVLFSFPFWYVHNSLQLNLSSHLGCRLTSLLDEVHTQWTFILYRTVPGLEAQASALHLCEVESSFGGKGKNLKNVAEAI